MVNTGHRRPCTGNVLSDHYFSSSNARSPQLRELYELLSANYVEDDDASFRFQYSAEFFSWCAYRY